VTTNSDYHRDLQDIRDRLDWVTELAEVDEFSGIEERLDNIEERFNNIEERLDSIVSSVNKVANFCEVLADAYKQFPAMVAGIVKEFTQPQTSPLSQAFNQAFSKAATAPPPSTKAKRAKPHKAKLTVVPPGGTATSPAHDNEPPKGAA
jgi:hypothetical protein